MKKILGIALLITLVADTFSQDVISTKGLRKTTTDSVSFYLDSAQFLSDKSPVRAIDFINKAIELSLKNEDIAREGVAFWVLGNIQQNLAQHDLAIESYAKCIKILTPRTSANGKISSGFKSAYSRSNDLTLFNAYKNQAISFTALNKQDEAIKAINNCLGTDFQFIPKINLLGAKRVLAEIRLNQRRTKDALALLNEIIAEEKEIGNKKGQIETYFLLGETYLRQLDQTAAINYFTDAKTLAADLKNNSLLIKANDLLANVYRKQKNVDKEVEIRNNTINLNKSYNNSLANAKENREIGNAYLNTNQVDKAETFYNISTKDTKIQEHPVQLDVQKLFSQSTDLEESANAYKNLAEKYFKEKEYVKATGYFNTYTSLQDSIKRIRKKEVTDAISLGSKIGKNQQRIDLLEKERELGEKSIEILKQDKQLKEEQLFTKNIIIGTLFCCMIFMIVAGFYMLKSSKEKRKANQILALKSLRGQMNPHFIFNALNSVNQYIAQNDERLANRYLTDFSRLMRLVMDSSKHDFIFLNDELEMLKLYLQLEQRRFQEKFEYEMEYQDEIKEDEFELPPMLIQPYIENAVWHGLRYREGKGFLKITFGYVNNELIVTILDNGIGRNQSIQLKTRNQKKQVSLGMQNIENRIEIMNAVFKTNIRLEINDAYPGTENPGTKITLFIPQKS